MSKYVNFHHKKIQKNTLLFITKNLITKFNLCDDIEIKQLINAIKSVNKLKQIIKTIWEIFNSISKTILLQMTRH